MKTEHVLLLITAAYAVLTVFVAMRIILETQNSVKTSAYLLLLFFMPVLGMIIYFTFGVNYRKRKLYHNKLLENKSLLASIQLRQDESLVLKKNNIGIIGNQEDIVDLLVHDLYSPLSDNNELELLFNGEAKFSRVLEQLELATHSIHIEYYIYDDDDIGNRLKEVLIRKASEGVSVRLIYDDFGSHSIRKKIVPELHAAGVEALPFYEVKFYLLANRYNYRDHRKIIVIDGKVGFLGGINISDRYINNKPKQIFWRDTHLMIKGSAVYSLQFLFLSNWNFCTEKPLSLIRDFFPDDIPTEKKQLVQIAASGPDSDRPSIMLAFITAITMAKKELYITSPYFIPSESILVALKKAALGGVDVRILVPGESDSAFVNLASRAYYGELLTAGVRIFLYRKGFVHAKTIIADNNLSIIGTANIDFRSFDLNFEAVAIVYDAATNEKMKSAFLEDLYESDEILPDDWLNRSKWIHLIEAIAKLVSPIL